MRIFIILLLLTIGAASPRAEAARKKPRARKPAADAGLCVTAAQFKRMSRYPIKAGCMVPGDGGLMCAVPACLGPSAPGDFDADGKPDKVFSILMADKDKPEDEYWGVFASTSRYQAVLHVGTEIRSRTGEPRFLQAGTSDSSGNQFNGWMIFIQNGTASERWSFDQDAKGYVLQDSRAGYPDGDPQYGGPGFGLQLLVGTNSNFTNTSTLPSVVTSISPGIGFQGSLRLDAYVGRFLSVETGLSYVNLSMKENVSAAFTSQGTTFVESGTVTATFNALEFPLLARFWPIPQLSLGGGPVYTQMQSTVGCSADGSVTCQSSSTPYSQTGFQGSFLQWAATVGYKSRIGDSGFWWVADLLFTFSPNIVSSASTAGVSSLSFINFQSYGGIRYGFFAN